MSDDEDEVPECLCGELMTIATIKKRWNCSVCSEAKAACSLRWNCGFCDRNACEECAWNQKEVEENWDEPLEDETLGLDFAECWLVIFDGFCLSHGVKITIENHHHLGEYVWDHFSIRIEPANQSWYVLKSDYTLVN